MEGRVSEVWRGGPVRYGGEGQVEMGSLQSLGFGEGVSRVMFGDGK